MLKHDIFQCDLFKIKRINETQKKQLPTNKFWKKGYPFVKFYNKISYNRKIFWLLQSYNDNKELIKRLDENSKSKHFPNSRFIKRIENKINSKILIENPFTEESIKFYEKYSPAEYISGKKKISSTKLIAEKNNINLYQSSLLVNNEEVSRVIYGLTNNSFIYIVPSSIRSKYSYGQIHLYKLILHYNSNNINYFSALVSKGVLSYKKRIFINSYEIL